MKIYYYPIILLIAGLLYSYWFGYTPVLVSVAYFVASIASYALYAKDKKAARRGAWRVQENTLHLTALLGGWPGALIAQQRLRHKTQKVSFRVVFAVTFLLNIGLLAWLHTAKASETLRYYSDNAGDWAVAQFGVNLGTAIVQELTAFHRPR
ncbi:cold-shock DNA-binding domain-containing protein [gamma proteobacterium BDW918]|nr:cold-shock DNA-binding domain-containing protein [gamma proteobacterium BDW918]